MLVFDPRDPFPQIAYGSVSYVDEQAHALKADSWLGLNVADTERSLSERGCLHRAPGASGQAQELWFGLSASSLMTPYVEIRRTLEAIILSSGSRVADLGAAYGRMGFVLARCFPGVRFVGYEYAGERVASGNGALARFTKSNGADVRLKHADLSATHLTPERADVYFIYDFGTDKAIEKTLYDLRRISLLQPFTLVARGTRCRRAIDLRHRDWLSVKADLAISDRSIIYKTAKSKRRHLSVGVVGFHEGNQSVR